MAIMVYSLLWVMQDLYIIRRTCPNRLGRDLGFKRCAGFGGSPRVFSRSFFVARAQVAEMSLINHGSFY